MAGGVVQWLGATPWIKRPRTDSGAKQGAGQVCGLGPQYGVCWSQTVRMFLFHQYFSISLSLSLLLFLKWIKAYFFKKRRKINSVCLQEQEGAEVEEGIEEKNCDGKNRVKGKNQD